MARLLRRFPEQSKLRPPTVVAPPVVFRPVAANLTNQKPQQTVLQRGTGSRLAPPPPATGPAVVFAPVRLKCVVRPRKAHHASSVLRLPATVGPAVVYGPVRTRMVQTSRTRQRPHSRLNAPTVIGSGGVVATVRRLPLLGVG